MKGVKAVDAAKEHFPAARFGSRPLVELVTLQAIALAEVDKGVGGGVEAREAPVGAEPDTAVIIFQNGVNEVIKQTVFFVVVGERFCDRVKLVQAIYRSHPQHAVAGQVQAEYNVTGEAVGVLSVVPV